MSAPAALIPNVLSVAGSDPSGGAGIQADIKTFAALGCHGMAVITAMTAQNTQRVSGIHLPPASFVTQQITTIFEDIDVAAIKIGMLGSAEIVDAVAAALRPHRDLPIVVDPVLVATSGATLGDDTVVAAMRATLFPLATLITPNLLEAARLAGRTAPQTHDEIEAIARSLHSGVRAEWLIKGGHGQGDAAEDFLLMGETARWFRSPRAKTPNTHGTGCTLSSAIAANLALGAPLEDAVARAKAYLDRALAGADRLAVGHGPGPVDHVADRRT